MHHRIKASVEYRGKFSAIWPGDVVPQRFSGVWFSGSGGNQGLLESFSAIYVTVKP